MTFFDFSGISLFSIMHQNTLMLSVPQEYVHHHFGPNSILICSNDSNAMHFLNKGKHEAQFPEQGKA